MTDVLWGLAVFALTLAALIIPQRVPEQPIPRFGETVGEWAEWIARCHQFHDSAQGGLRNIYGLLAATEALAWVVANFLHLGIRYAATALVIAFATVAAGIPAAQWWERVERVRLQEHREVLGQPPSL